MPKGLLTTAHVPNTEIARVHLPRTLTNAQREVLAQWLRDDVWERRGEVVAGWWMAPPFIGLLGMATSVALGFLGFIELPSAAVALTASTIAFVVGANVFSWLPRRVRRCGRNVVGVVGTNPLRVCYELEGERHEVNVSDHDVKRHPGGALVPLVVDTRFPKTPMILSSMSRDDFVEDERERAEEAAMRRAADD